MKYIFRKNFSIFVGILIICSCETIENDLTVSPNALSIDSADPNFVLNQIQVDLNRMFSGLRDETMELTRLIYMFDAYPANIESTTLNTFAAPNDQNEWTRAYRINGNRLLLEALASTNPDLNKHVGVAGLITAYTTTTLVDILGDVPFSEANINEIDQPSPDDDAEIYNRMFELIDASILKLSDATTNTIGLDLYYGGDISKWITFGNTLKLKMYNQINRVDAIRATAEINSLIASNNLIDTVDEDFQLNFSTVDSPVESRHNFFTQAYLSGGADIGLYMNNEFMNTLLENNDPRLRYYFYRQSLTEPTGDDLPCTADADECYIGNFYWGRIHADSQGIPADNLARTIYGIYPGGGAFDNDDDLPGVSNQGLNGMGINPIFLSSFTKFVLAESAITLGTSGDPKILLEEGIRSHIQKVLNFGASEAGNSAPTAMEVDTYVANVLLQYDAATDDQQRLAIILGQYHIASFGNGIEAYNFYRKTGLPELQDPLSPSPFPRSFILPSDETLANDNISTNALTDQVFWDNNPQNFID